MAKIKGITVQIGAETKGLDKALKDVNKSSRDIQKELREVDKLLRFNPKNTELITQKQKLLGDQVNVTKEKLDKLKIAEEQAQEQFAKGEISEEQYRALQREIIETESKLNHYEGKLKDVMVTTKSFGERAQELSDKMKKVGDGMYDAGKTMTKSITAPALAAGGAIFALAKKSGDYADRILDLRDITGLSTDSIQEWQHVAVVAGVSTETMTSAVEGLIKKIPQLESEGGKATDAIEKLGISWEDLGDMTPDEQMDTMISMLADMEDTTERNAIGAQLFGGAWKDLAPILGMGSEAIAETRDEAHDLGNVLSGDSLNNANDFRIEMDKMKESVKNAGMQIGSDLAPLLQDTLVPLIEEKVVPGIKNMVEKVRDAIEWYKNLSPPIKDAIKIIGGIIIAIGPFLMIAGKMISIVSSVIGIVGKMGGAISFLASPIGIAIAAIAAIVAIGVTLWKNWDTIKEKAAQLGTYLSGKFQDIKAGITRPIESARDTISGTVDKIKGFFTGLKLKLPKITIPKLPRLPRPTITGSFSLLPPRVPKISWNAMGGLMDGATIFGGIGNTLLGGGEAGKEGIVPLEGKHMMPLADAIAKRLCGSGTTIIVEEMIVRDDRDIGKIARELHILEQRQKRARGFA